MAGEGPALSGRPAGQRLSVLPGRYAVCRLEPGAPVPSGVLDAAFASVTRTSDELSVVCPEGLAPAGSRVEPGWRAIRLHGPFDFALTGILASVASPLAAAGIGIFALATFDTDFVLVKDADLARALEALRAAGHELLAG